MVMKEHITQGMDQKLHFVPLYKNDTKISEHVNINAIKVYISH